MINAPIRPRDQLLPGCLYESGDVYSQRGLALLIDLVEWDGEVVSNNCNSPDCDQGIGLLRVRSRHKHLAAYIRHEGARLNNLV